ncbi:MAG: NfeD family protein [Prevotella sp.]|nr:NfeD family protein [Prevotella sp.]
MIDYLSQHLWQLWAVVAVVCLILELTAGDFFILCFSIGALFAGIADVLGLSLYWQIGAFALFTLISLYFVRPVALRYLHRNDEQRLSNADALIGRRGRVVEKIEAGGYGRVAIDGDVWKAVCETSDPVEVGTFVRVVDRESITITVKPA